MFTNEEYKKGEEYREIWYRVRNHEIVFDWRIISQKSRDSWTKEALMESGLGE